MTFDRINRRPLKELARDRYVCCGPAGHTPDGAKENHTLSIAEGWYLPDANPYTSNSVGWIEEEVNTWIAGRVAASKPLRIK
jgi:hypothetical protein